MKKTFIIFCLFEFLFLLANNCLFAQDNFKKTGQSGMQYLKIGVDAAMVGKGEAGISAVQGVSSIFWNPAGLANMESNELLFSHNNWIADISLNAFAAGIPLGNYGNVGVSLVWMDYGKLYATAVATNVSEATEFGYIDKGTFSPSDMALGITYSKKISEQFSVGGSVKYLYENYGSNTIVTLDGQEENVNNILSGVCFDLGTVYHPDYKSLSLSMVIQNFSPDMKYQQESFSPPLTFKFGLSMNLMDFIDEGSRSKFLVAIDALHPRDYSERINLGAEYDYLGLFQLRGGYRINYDEGNFTAGAGVRYSLMNGMQFRFDVSYLVISSGRFTSPLQLTAGLNF